jgi:hypothetical protein
MRPLLSAFVCGWHYCFGRFRFCFCVTLLFLTGFGYTSAYTHWRENDAQVKDLDYKKYSTLPDDATIARAQAGLEKSGAVVHVVNNKAEALAAVQKLIAAKPGASVMNAGSTVRTASSYRPTDRRRYLAFVATLIVYNPCYCLY